jgi:nucleotide-binding universal stress UspA family protein
MTVHGSEPVRDATSEGADRSDDALLARIVCGVDRSEASMEAVRQAVRLAAPWSELILVAVAETRLAVHAGMRAPHVQQSIEADANAALESATALAGEATTRLMRGRPDDALLQLAAEERATLVAVGSTGYGRGVGIAIGSVATRMLHDAPCSILVARAPEDTATFPCSIVAGVDGSLPSLRAASVAASLGKRLGVPVTFLAAKGSRADFNGDRLGESGLELVFSDAKPMPALLEAAADADLMILGSRGLRGLRALGSVSERVAHRARSSLLIVREP